MRTLIQFIQLITYIASIYQDTRKQSLINMAFDGDSGISFHGVSPVAGNCFTPEACALENYVSESLDNFCPRNSTVVPNRIFVRGFDHEVSERDLWHIFSKYGSVKQVNIRASKRYGFVTFENTDDARKLLFKTNEIFFKNQRLFIRPAFRKTPRTDISALSMLALEPVQHMPSYASVYSTTSSGFPYTFHNDVAYFHNPQDRPVQHLWTPPQPPAPVMPQPYQPLYQQQPYQHYQPQSFPNQWNNIEAPLGPAPVICAQPEYVHFLPNGAPFLQPTLPYMNQANVENFMDLPPQVPSAQASSDSRDLPMVLELPESES